jgi:hypothetical protein
MPRTLVGACLAMLLPACTSTRLADVWRDRSWTGGPLRHVALFALDRDVTARRIFEDRFADRLTVRGVCPERSYLLLPGDEKPTEQQVRAAVERSGADGALLTNLVGVSRRASISSAYVAPYVRYGPFFPDFYGTWGVVYAPGYLDTETVVRLSTRLYAADGDGRLLWSGDSETLNPGSMRDLAGDVIGRVVEALVKVRLLP